MVFQKNNMMGSKKVINNNQFMRARFTIVKDYGGLLNNNILYHRNEENFDLESDFPMTWGTDANLSMDLGEDRVSKNEIGLK